MNGHNRLKLFKAVLRYLKHSTILDPTIQNDLSNWAAFATAGSQLSRFFVYNSIVGFGGLSNSPILTTAT